MRERADRVTAPADDAAMSLPPGRAGLAAALLALAAAGFALGLYLPIIKLERLFVFTDEHSIVTMIQALFSEGEVLLGLIIVTFSVVLPALKILTLAVLLACNGARLPPWLIHLIAVLGRWSMLDVLVVAIVIVAMKTSGIGSALSQPGLYFFTASVVLTMVAASLARPGGGPIR